MKPNQFPHEQKLRALPVQLIETTDGIILKRGRMEMKIGGEHAEEVVSIVLTATTEDGATRDEICELFAGPTRPAVASLIQQLESRRILVPSQVGEGEVLPTESQLDVFYWHFGEQPQHVVSRLNDQHIVIMGVNYISRQMVSSFVEAGMKNFDVVDYSLLRNLRLFNDANELITGQWSKPLSLPVAYDKWVEKINLETLGCLVATSDFGGLHSMRKWNEFCVQQNIHFLPVVLQDLIGYIGPLVVPGETACFECLRARENSNMDAPSIMRATELAAFQGQAEVGFHPSMASVLADIAVLELSKFYGGWMWSQSIGTSIEVNLLAAQMTPHKVLKLPRCRVCSSLNKRSSISFYKDLVMPGNEVER